MKSVTVQGDCNSFFASIVLCMGCARGGGRGAAAPCALATLVPLQLKYWLYLNALTSSQNTSESRKICHSQTKVS